MTQAPVGTSIESLVKGFILTQRTDCKSPRTIEYYEGNLKRFLWYAGQQKWSDDAKLITEWNVREGGVTHRLRKGLVPHRTQYCMVHALTVAQFINAMQRQSDLGEDFQSFLDGYWAT